MKTRSAELLDFYFAESFNEELTPLEQELKTACSTYSLNYSESSLETTSGIVASSVLPGNLASIAPAADSSSNEQKVTAIIKLDDALYYQESYIFSRQIDNVIDIDELQDYLKHIKTLEAPSDSAIKIKMLAKRIALLYLVKPAPDEHPIMLLDYWMKALNFALETREATFVDPIWKLQSKEWQTCFCSVYDNNIEACLDRFIMSLEASQYSMSKQIWDQNTCILTQFIAVLPDKRKEEILRKIIINGTDEIINLYLQSLKDTLNNLRLLEMCLSVIRSNHYCLSRVVLLRTKIQVIKNALTPTPALPAGRMSPLDTWVGSLIRECRNGTANINVLWDEKPETWQAYFCGLKVDIDGVAKQIAPQEWNLHFIATLTTRNKKIAEIFWVKSKHIFLQLQPNEQFNLFKKVISNGTYNLFHSFLKSITDIDMINRSIKFTEDSADPVEQRRGLVLKNKKISLELMLKEKPSQDSRIVSKDSSQSFASCKGTLFNNKPVVASSPATAVDVRKRSSHQAGINQK